MHTPKHKSMMTSDINRIEIQAYPDGRLDAHNASLYLGLSEKTLAMMRCEGRGPKFIKRGRVFYYLEDIQDWIQSASKQSSTAQSRFSRF